MNAAVILAAGRGERMGQGCNKALLPLLGVPMIVRTVRVFRDSALFDPIVVTASAGDLPRMRALLCEEGVTLVEGGWDRQESVRRGIEACPRDAEFIAIHDGARPLVTREIIERTLESARAYGSGVAAVPLKDTVKRVDSEGFVIDTPPRDALRAVQTPQTFRAALIREAHARALSGERATDDAALVERMGERVHLTEGDEENIKLTTPADMRMAEQVLRRRAEGEGDALVRVGHGYDVHRLVSGRKLILCGVEVPYDRGLLGHSDADVALHALMDALLGAAALGDIGRHFPDDDPAYEGADSGQLLQRVVQMLSSRGYRVQNVDITIIAQRPRLQGFIGQMRQSTAAHLGVPVDRVNVKATTTEQLGFEGEGLGISAHAVACIAPALSSPRGG